MVFRLDGAGLAKHMLVSLRMDSRSKVCITLSFALGVC